MDAIILLYSWGGLSVGRHAPQQSVNLNLEGNNSKDDLLLHRDVYHVQRREHAQAR